MARRSKDGGLAPDYISEKNNRAFPSAKGARLFFHFPDDCDDQRNQAYQENPEQQQDCNGLVAHHGLTSLRVVQLTSLRESKP